MIGMIALGAVLIVAWLLGFIVFKVAGFFIHLLLMVGAIVLIVGLMKKAGGRISSSA